MSEFDETDLDEMRDEYESQLDAMRNMALVRKEMEKHRWQQVASLLKEVLVLVDMETKR
jgi:hypothetical protein